MSQTTTKISPSSPLLAKPTPSNSNSTSVSPTTTPIPSTSAFAINTMAIGRIAFGASCLLAPTLTFSLFKLPLPPSMTLLARMWGGRELALGEWLWTADYEDSERKELKRAMRLNALVDAVDLGSVGYAFARGTVGKLPGGLLAGGALASVAMDLWGLRGL